MSAKCRTCGAPVTLAPDGDPRYARPGRLATVESQTPAAAPPETPQTEALRKLLKAWETRALNVETERDAALAELDRLKKPVADGEVKEVLDALIDWQERLFPPRERPLPLPIVQKAHSVISRLSSRVEEAERAALTVSHILKRALDGNQTIDSPEDHVTWLTSVVTDAALTLSKLQVR